MLANCLHAARDYAAAGELFADALPAVRTAQGNTFLVRAALAAHAACMRQQGRLEDAAALFQDASALYRAAGHTGKSDEALRSALHCQQLVVQSMRTHGQTGSQSGERHTADGGLDGPVRASVGGAAAPAE